MKKVLFFLVTLLSLETYSQSQTMLAALASNCGCPGEIWNTTNAAKPNVGFSAPGVSKRVMFTNYGFTIPGDASITGIEVVYSYSTNAQGMDLSDESVYLLYWGNLSGSDKSGLTTHYSGTNTITLGGVNDTWGITFFPADVNADNFGFNFKLNSSVAATQFSFLNGAYITVHYITPNGIRESQTSYAGAKVAVNNKQVKFVSEENEKTHLAIYTLEGKEIYNAQYKGTADLTSFEKGIYVYHIKSETGIKRGKFVLD